VYLVLSPQLVWHINCRVCAHRWPGVGLVRGGVEVGDGDEGAEQGLLLLLVRECSPG